MLLTIGLEIHIKLKSANKMFCQCKNEQNFENLLPNTNICPVCTGQPGALPTLSEEVLEKALLLGKALKCKINENSTFDRKSYFYPDLPMGYQITQLYHPTNTEGQVSFFLDNYTYERTVHIQDAHMENDTGKMIHNSGQAMIDFNRAGTPLVEIVTLPDFRTTEEVIEFLKELQRLVRFNDIADADLEKGQMRVDVNISVRKSEADPFGTRVEVKNINSFGMIKRAIEHEQTRQEKLYETGEIFSQQTRGRDDAKGESYLMRSKEDALDYRYFPEPDLPALHIDNERRRKITAQLTIIPHEIIKTMKEQYGFNKEYINTLIGDKETFDYFMKFVTIYGRDPKIIAKWISGPIAARTKENFKNIQELPFTNEQFGEFLGKAQAGSLMESQLKIIMDEMLNNHEEGTLNFWIRVEKNPEFKNINSNIVFMDKKGGNAGPTFTITKKGNILDIIIENIHNGTINIQQNIEKYLTNDMMVTVTRMKTAIKLYLNGSIVANTQDLEEIIKEKGFDAPAMDENEIELMAKKILEENPTIVEQYKEGKTTTIGFFIGQLMKKTGGKTSPKIAQDIFEKLLG